ncbi:protein kinase [Myxococcota bacterium]
MTPGFAQLISVQPPQRRLGQYELVRQLGRGGFAPVWIARERLGDSAVGEVAVRLFDVGAAPHSPESLEASPVARQQLDTVLQRARALRRVDHPNVVRFLGTAISTDRSIIALVAEYVRGPSLQDSLGIDGRLTVERTLDVGRALASALAALHQAGLVHCDVKPTNVLFAEGVAKLTHFSVALRGPAPPALHEDCALSVVIDDLPESAHGTRGVSHLSRIRTPAGVPLSALFTAETVPPVSGDRATSVQAQTALASPSGVLRYLDPWRCGALGLGGTVGYVDPASFTQPTTETSDLYSLGAALFECLTGHVPAAQAQRLLGGKGISGAVLDGSEPPPEVRRIRDDVPEALSHLIARLLAPDPSQRPRSAEIVALELGRLRQHPAAPVGGLPPEEEGPFRGLQCYDQSHQAVFWGRATEVAGILERLRTSGLLALVGPSGCGKSSLARAGVIPAVHEGQLGQWPPQWRSIITTPTANPHQTLGTALEAIVPEATQHSPEILTAALGRYAQEHNEGILLLVDRVEELVTLCDGPAQTWAARLLGLFGSTTLPGVRCVVVARDDLLAPLLQLSELGPSLSRQMMLVRPISQAAWAETIDQALQVYGFRFESAEPRSQLLAEIRSAPEAMPLIQFALAQLWQHRDPGKRIIPEKSLHRLGSLASALDDHAETLRAELVAANASLNQTLCRVVVSLTTPQGTQAPLRLEQLEQVDEPRKVRRVLRMLDKMGLVVCEGDHFTLAHETLFVYWERARGWLSAIRADHELREELERAANNWLESAEDPRRLWRQHQLARARHLLENRRVRVSANARKFVRMGRVVERQGKTRLASVGVALFLLGTAGTGGYIDQQHRHLETARNSSVKAEHDRQQAEASEQEARRVALLATQAKRREQQLRERLAAELNRLETSIGQARTAMELTRIRKAVRQKRGAIPPEPSGPSPSDPDPAATPLSRP